MKLASLAALAASLAFAAGPGVVFESGKGPGRGKHVVLIAGDEEYRSEEALPQLARILSQRHGFRCTVLFAIDPADGTVDPTKNNNIPGLDALDAADLMVLFTRWRDLPDDQVQPFVRFLKAGKPIVAIRTATHPFNFKTHPSFARWSSASKEWDGGFGRQILGETWISHHGAHGKQSTRGIPAPGKAGHPILKGVASVWGPTDVYTVRQPFPPENDVLLLGAVLTGMDPKDPPLEGPKNDPMMPVAWTRMYQYENGKPGRAFTTTMGSAQDLADDGFRRLLINAVYWASGMEKKISPSMNINLVGEYTPSPFRFNGHQKGRKPEAF